MTRESLLSLCFSFSPGSSFFPFVPFSLTVLTAQGKRKGKAIVGTSKDLISTSRSLFNPWLAAGLASIEKRRSWWRKLLPPGIFGLDRGLWWISSFAGDSLFRNSPLSPFTLIYCCDMDRNYYLNNYLINFQFIWSLLSIPVSILNTHIQIQYLNLDLKTLLIFYWTVIFTRRLHENYTFISPKRQCVNLTWYYFKTLFY